MIIRNLWKYLEPALINGENNSKSLNEPRTKFIKESNIKASCVSLHFVYV